MIAFVEIKRPDYDWVQAQLADSETIGTWTNFGPVSRRLEKTVSEILALPAERKVIACASGTVALHCLVQLYEHLAGRSLRWVVSAFTFHAQLQGPLASARVLDCDTHGFLNPDALAELPADSYDGIIVTNLFGTARYIERYEGLARQAGKILIFDSATCFGTTYGGVPLGQRGDGELFSFHHTKPCGFGEGGCVVVPAQLEDVFRSLINFGLYKGIDTGTRSSNGKMSDVAAAFILDRLRDYENIRAAHLRESRRLGDIAKELGLALLVDGVQEGAFPNLLAILFPNEVGLERLSGGPFMAHKYYRPVAPTPYASRLYSNVVCFPCHRDVSQVSDDEIGNALAELMH